jgi:putative ABC transport system permease protein
MHAEAHSRTASVDFISVPRSIETHEDLKWGEKRGHDVARRRHELGVRLALGATGGQLVTIVLWDAAGILIPALAMGLPLGVALSRLLSSQLYGVGTGDPWIVVSAGVLLSIVAMGAAFRPATTASRIDPTALLRHE